MVRVGVRQGIMAILALSSGAGYAPAQSPAAALSGYEQILKVTSVAGLSANSISGVAFHPETKTLFVVDNQNAMIYELSKAGALLRSMATTGIDDPEGISYQGDDFFLITEEGLANVARVKLPRTGSGPVAKAGGASLNLGPDMANSGIEGVSYRPSDKAVFAAKESSPSRLYRITVVGAGVPNASFPGEPFDVSAHGGDIADILALNDGNFILVNDEGNKLEGFGPQGQALSSLSLGMTQPEGIAIDTADGTIYVVGEPQELSVFKRKTTRVRRNLTEKTGKAGRGESGPGETGFSCSLSTQGATGSATVLRYILPRRTSVRIRFITLEGAGHEVFSGVVDAGEHSLALSRPGTFTASVAPVASARIGFYRFTAGDFTRILKSVSW
jgi:uncharacterized protein YjiK